MSSPAASTSDRTQQRAGDDYHRCFSGAHYAIKGISRTDRVCLDHVVCTLTRLSVAGNGSQLTVWPLLSRERCDWRYDQDSPGVIGADAPSPAVAGELLRCPACDAYAWSADLLLLGVAVLTCGRCGWRELASEIERRIRDGEL